ncbi:MAG: threonylcarbamoyl-AMP synthase [Bacteroidales bacterium]|jgi:L-threonylcarbamoyladenylate synthase|nr:threonylcarbamoyl-AMP synthase [Bacteroidales bacterium]
MNISEEIIRTNDHLNRGSIILYPTDTIWGLGCDATNVAAIDKIFTIKRRRTTKSLLILLDEVEKLSLYLDHIPEIAWDLIEHTNRPTTFIYNHVKNLPKNLIAPDGTIAIRIVKNEFCKRLISLFGKPIVSTSANISGKPTPALFKDISPEIKSLVDYIVDTSVSQLEDTKPSTMIRFLDDYTFEVIRE